MTTRIILRDNSNSGSVPQPSELMQAELVLNSADGFLFTKNASGQVVLLNPPTDLTSASYALTASYALNAAGSSVSSSYALTSSFAVSSSYAVTASYVSGASNSSISSSYALTASFATVAATASYFSGGFTFSNGLIVTGSVTASAYTGSFTGSLLGSSSYAQTASSSLVAISSSFATSASFATTAITAVSSSVAISASFAQNSATASYFDGNVNFPNGLVVSGSVTASAYTGSFTGSLFGSSSFATTASFALRAISASWAPGVGGAVEWSTIINKPDGLVSSSVQVNTGSFSGSFTGSVLGTSSVALSVISSSYALTSSYAQNAATASSLLGSITGGIEFPNGLVVTGSIIATTGFTGSLSGSAISASYALTSSFAQTAVTASYISGTVGFPNGLIVTGSVIATGGFTGSLSGSITSASYALTASFATLAATASFSTGTIDFPNGLLVTGSVTASAYTGSLTGSATNATSASYAVTASHIAPRISRVVTLNNGLANGQIDLTNIPVTIQEWATSQQTYIDLSTATDFRLSLDVVSGSISGAFAAPQVSTNQTSWSFMANPLTTNAPLHITGVVTSSWSAITPSLRSDNLYMRWVTVSGSSTTNAQIGTFNVWYR